MAMQDMPWMPGASHWYDIGPGTEGEGPSMADIYRHISSAACAAANRAIGTRKGEQDT
jgi:hypothetical protein